MRSSEQHGESAAVPFWATTKTAVPVLWGGSTAVAADVTDVHGRTIDPILEPRDGRARGGVEIADEQPELLFEQFLQGRVLRTEQVMQRGAACRWDLGAMHSA